MIIEISLVSINVRGSHNRLVVLIVRSRSPFRADKPPEGPALLKKPPLIVSLKGVKNNDAFVIVLKSNCN
jgi:hypothetical protein